MWINEYVCGRSFEKEGASCGEISAAKAGTVTVSGTRDRCDVPQAAPYGIAYVPTAGTKAYVVPCEGGAVCIGVAMEPPQNLEAGELMLYSAGGARLVLKNDGRVLINGREV